MQLSSLQMSFPYSFLITLCGLWDLSSPTRNWTRPHQTLTTGPPGEFPAVDLCNFSWFLFMVTSPLLQYSALLLIAFLNSFIFSLSPFWNQCLLDWSGLLYCLSFQGNALGFLPGFLCFFILLLFLLLCEFRRNNYRLRSGRTISMWRHPCVTCVGLIYLVQGLLLVWMSVTSFLRVC